MSQYGGYVAQYVGDYVLQVGFALLVLIAATVAWVMSRRKYVKPAYLKRRLEALRLEFRHSIDEARAATARKVAGIGDSLLSVIKQVDSSITDLNVRLGKLDEHADAVESFMAGSQKQALEQNAQIYARLTKLERRLTTLTDQLSLIQQTIEGAINARLMNTQKQVDELLPRLEVGEKARADLGTLIGLFVKQLKRVNVNSAETALRVADLENLRSKVTGLEERLSSTLDREKDRSGGNSTNTFGDNIDRLRIH